MPDTQKIVQSIGQATYVWDLKTGKIDWSSNFPELIGINPKIKFDCAREFDSLLSVDSPQTRFAAIQERSAGPVDVTGTTYQCTYAIRAEVVRNRRLLWIEDTGRCYPDENGKPQRAEGIIRIINDRRQREETLRRKSEVDELTGLANRQILQSMIRKTADDCFMNDKEAAFLLISLDDFDRVNHTYGFAVGDEVLQKVSWLLRKHMRSDDFPARFSGAKFGILLKDCPQEQVHKAVDRLLSGLGETVIHTSGGPVALKLSAGACLIPGHAMQDQDAIAAATSALDVARSSFGKSFCLFEPEDDVAKSRQRKAALLRQFVSAIEEDRIKLSYQPIVDAESGKAVFYEALLRLDGVDDEWFNNADFLQLAENLGLMRMLDQRSLHMGLDVLESHQDACLSVNVTHDSLENGNWLSMLHDRLNDRPDIAKRLVVELTESHLPSDIAGTVAAVRKMKKLGCRVAIDDFGAGYTSFLHLRDLGADIVKIDGSYARDLTSDPQNEIFLRAVREMTHAFGLKTVIEWVGDIDTALWLKEMGHDYFQGSLYGMPLPISPWTKEPGSLLENKTDKTH